MFEIKKRNGFWRVYRVSGNMAVRHHETQLAKCKSLEAAQKVLAHYEDRESLLLAACRHA